ncbi:MAG TPA: UDP-N-acetylmuramate dehydrogenase [Mycobacteriales bacterium]|nr:UDP-N-acetylmuramate dehydrogenase [Mycobacteriales bacterium]
MREATGVPLAPLTTLRLGGPARRLVEADTEAEIIECVRTVTGPLLVLGGGSNVVVADDGFPGTVVRVRSRGVAVDGDLVTAQAGEDWDGFVAAAVEAGRVGVEALSGIPGLVGATPIQNVGAYGQEVAHTVVSVRAWDRVEGRVATLPAVDCAFRYRSSRFKRTPERWVVLAVTFRLPACARSTPVGYAELARALGVPVGDRASPAAVRDAVLALRRGKGMVLDAADPDTRSAGSFFTNPVVDREVLAGVRSRTGAAVPSWPAEDGRVKVSAGWLIEQAGFGRGYGPGAVRLSTKHALALTHTGGGSTAGLLALAREVRDAVRDRFGVTLVPEPVLVGVSL